MPKILLYITAKIMWQFLFWNTDYHENRAHVHVGKRGTEHLCKIWLEPIVEVAQQGDLTDAQTKEVLTIASEYREKLLHQWSLFKEGKRIRLITIKKPKIKRLSFPKRGKFQVDLQDGRSVTMPISAFPSLKKVPMKERENWYLIGGGVTWDSCSEVIHIEQILGNYQNYAHEMV